MPRVRATVGYDGSVFHGFAENPGVPTVAGSVRATLERVFRVPTPVICAGRTDKGVHGLGQVISFDAPDSFDSVRLTRSLNKACNPEIVISEIAIAAPDFDARFSATGRTYHYRILTTAIADPLRRSLAWHVSEPLDMEVLQSAVNSLVGLHDFTTFCRKPKGVVSEPPPTMMRRIHTADWTEKGDELELEISAKSFCHQMVRSIVGTAVDIGRGELPLDAMPAILAAQDRQQVGTVAPAHGLILWSVSY
jgi:tRNA pseudouridine38-40 synthase